MGVTVGDQLRRDHQQRERRPVSQGKYQLLDIGRARREIHNQAVDGIPGGARDQAMDQQLGQRRLEAKPLALADQQGRGGDLHTMPLGSLQPRGTGSRHREHRDVPGILAAPQAHHVSGIGAVQVRVDQADAAHRARSGPTRC